MSRSGDSDPLLGRVLDGKFTLLSVLGRGGMGVVYRAHQKSLERPLALKLMMAHPHGDPGGDATEEEQARDNEFQRRFFLEAATAAKLKHPNTITVFDYGSTLVDDNKVFYITMELLDGVTLSKLLAKEGPLPPLRAINIALQICRSLREAHAGGIVHRDLKPGNVMLVRHDAQGDADGDDDGDFVKVLDFGLAKSRGSAARGTGPQLTKAGTFLGSPRYVAPEQIEGRPVDGRADIYSFGCVFYRMLSGRVPFDGQQAAEVMLKHLHDPVPPLSTPQLSIPFSLEQLVLKCLAKKDSDRPSSMDEVITVLKRARAEITGVMSGNISIPEDLRARLTRELGEGANSGPFPLPVRPASQPSDPPASNKPEPTTPSSSSSSSSSSSAGFGPTSGEWQLGARPEAPTQRSGPDFGPSGDESTRPTHVMGGPLVPARRRKAQAAIAAGVVGGVVVAAVCIAFRLGHLDPLVAQIVGTSSAEAPSSPRPPPQRATHKASARLRIKTEPAGADVFDVSSAVPRLLGITPLVLPWEIAVGDAGRELLLKLPGHVAARARVEPPPSARGLASSTREPVVLDVNATLRPVPPR